MGVPEVDAVVAGAGIAGLAAALELQGRGREVLVIDPSDRPGGVLRTDHVAGFVVERGPNTRAGEGADAPLPRASAGSRARSSRRGPASRIRARLPRRRLVRVPASPLGLLTHAAALGARQAAPARASRSCAAATRAAETRRRVRRAARRRRGACARLVGPVPHRRLRRRRGAARRRGGLRHGGRARAAPRLARVRRAASSLVAAPRARTARELRRPARLRAAGARSSRVSSSSRPRSAAASRASRATATRWHLDIGAPTRRHARCARAASCSRCRRRVAARGAARRRRGGRRRRWPGIAYAPIVSVALGIEPKDARARIEGFGFLVPRERAAAAARLPVHEPALPGPRAGGQRAPPVHARRRALARGRRAAGRRAARGAARRPRAHARLPRRAAACSAWRAGRARSRSPAATTSRACASRSERAAAGLALAGSYVTGIGVADALASGLAAARVAVERREPPRARAPQRPRPSAGCAFRLGTSTSSSPPSARHCARARMPISSSVSRQSATKAGHSTASRRTPARRSRGSSTSV